MQAQRIGERIAAMAAQPAELVGEPMETLSTAERCALAAQWRMTSDIRFDNHSEQPLYLGRAQRCASPAQRLKLYAKDRGCSFPGCTAPAYHSQVYHAVTDWAAGGHTDITEETLACGPHNRRAKPGAWKTRKRGDGRTEWLPPPNLDTGQARTNRSSSRALPHPRQRRPNR